VLDRVQVDMRNVVVDRQKQRVVRFGKADASARVLAAHLTAYLEARPNLEPAQVSSRPDRIAMNTRSVIPGIALREDATVAMQGRPGSDRGRLHSCFGFESAESVSYVRWHASRRTDRLRRRAERLRLGSTAGARILLVIRGRIEPETIHYG
jgi:hypothetical protein